MLSDTARWGLFLYLFIYFDELFNDALSTSDYAASNVEWLVNTELERILA
jgi:hypothetical protein